MNIVACATPSSPVPRASHSSRRRRRGSGRTASPCARGSGTGRDAGPSWRSRGCRRGRRPRRSRARPRRRRASSRCSRRCATGRPAGRRPAGWAGFAQVGDPDRPAVADQAVVQRGRGRAARLRIDRPEPVLVGAPRRAAGPDVLAVLDAARRVARRQLDEVADLPHVARVRVRDDEEAALAVRVADRVPSVARARRGRAAGVVVPRIERADDQLALGVELHVLVLPVAAAASSAGRSRRQELVQRLRVRRVADVVRLEAEAARDDEDVLAAHLVELALGDAGRARGTRFTYSRLSEIAAPGGGSAALAIAGMSSSAAIAAANVPLPLIVPPLRVDGYGARSYRTASGRRRLDVDARGRRAGWPSTSQVMSTWSFLR